MTTQQSKQRAPEDLIKHMQSTMETMAKVADALSKREQRIAQREKEMGIITQTTKTTAADIKTEVIDANNVSNRLFELGYQGYKLVSNNAHPDAPGKQVIRYAKGGDQ